MRITLAMWLCLLGAQSQVVAQDNERATANDSLSVIPRGALLRSAVIPGWGQLHNGHPWKAALFAGTASGLLASALLEVRSLNGVTTAEARDTRSNRRNTRFLYFGLTVTLAAIDAYPAEEMDIFLVKNAEGGPHAAVRAGFDATTAPAVLVYMADDDYNADRDHNCTH